MLSALLLSCILVVHDDDTDKPEPETCDDVQVAFAAELAAVQTCTEAEQCGQVLTGTSCGCTRDLVARLDADTEHLYALVDLAAQRGCDLGLSSPCDCPEVDGFACDDGTCGWSYGETPALPECRAADGDPYVLVDVTVEADQLLVTASSSGGCLVHDWTLCWPDGAFMESWPVQARLDILHDDLDDPCDAIVTADMAFDLSPLKLQWWEQYGVGEGVIVVLLGDFRVEYGF